MDAEPLIWIIPLGAITIVLIVFLISYIRWLNDPDTKWYRTITKGLEKNKHEWWDSSRSDNQSIKSKYQYGTIEIKWRGYLSHPEVYIDGSEKPLELSYETRHKIDDYINTVRYSYYRNKEKFDEKIRKTILAQKYYDKCVSRSYYW